MTASQLLTAWRVRDSRYAAWKPHGSLSVPPVARAAIVAWRCREVEVFLPAVERPPMLARAQADWAPR